MKNLKTFSEFLNENQDLNEAVDLNDSWIVNNLGKGTYIIRALLQELMHGGALMNINNVPVRSLERSTRPNPANEELWREIEKVLAPALKKYDLKLDKWKPNTNLTVQGKDIQGFLKAWNKAFTDAGWDRDKKWSETYVLKNDGSPEPLIKVLTTIK